MGPCRDGVPAGGELGTPPTPPHNTHPHHTATTPSSVRPGATVVMPCCAARGAAGAWYLPWLLLASGTAGSRPSNSYALRLAAGWGPAGGPGSRRVATTTTGAGARASGPETGGGGGGGDGDKEAERLLASFVDHEKQGVPKDAGTGASGAFDLGRMRRLLERLGSPERRWPVVHVAGSKGGSQLAAVYLLHGVASLTLGSTLGFGAKPRGGADQLRGGGAAVLHGLGGWHRASRPQGGETHLADRAVGPSSQADAKDA